MDPGLFTAATGMIAKAFIQNVIGKNIANASTTGYKRERVVEGDFSDHLARALGVDPSLRRKSGTYVDDVVTDFSQGDIKHTGDLFDLAIDGNGFFVVQGVDGQLYYTRDGSFRVDKNGMLVTKEGLPVIAEGGGHITIPQTAGSGSTMDGTFGVADDGSVYIFSGNPPARVPLGKLRIAAFENPGGLQRLGAGFYANAGGQAIEVPAQVNIMQGALELPNFNMVQEFVGMIQNQRYYDAAQKVIKTIDSSIGALITMVG